MGGVPRRRVGCLRLQGLKLSEVTGLHSLNPDRLEVASNDVRNAVVGLQPAMDHKRRALTNHPPMLGPNVGQHDDIEQPRLVFEVEEIHASGG